LTTSQEEQSSPRARSIERYLVPSLHGRDETSAEREGIGLHTSIEELDLELSIDDRLRLSDQLMVSRRSPRAHETRCVSVDLSDQGIDDTFVSGRHGTDTKVLWTIARRASILRSRAAFDQ